VGALVGRSPCTCRPCNLQRTRQGQARVNRRIQRQVCRCTTNSHACEAARSGRVRRKATQRRRERLAQGSHRQSTQAVGRRACGCVRFGARGAAVVRVRGSGGPGEEEGVCVGVGVGVGGGGGGV
jgi:hypothetical protein